MPTRKEVDPESKESPKMVVKEILSVLQAHDQLRLPELLDAIDNDRRVVVLQCQELAEQQLIEETAPSTYRLTNEGEQYLREIEEVITDTQSKKWTETDSTENTEFEWIGDHDE